jgi:hypothetical protein
VVHAGPFTPEAPPEFGYQLPYPPRELYKKGLAEFDAAIRQQYGHGYVELNTQQREKMMGEFEKGEQGSIKMATIRLRRCSTCCCRTCTKAISATPPMAATRAWVRGR